MDAGICSAPVTPRSTHARSWIQHGPAPRVCCIAHYLRTAADVFLRRRYDSDCLAVPTQLVFGNDDVIVPKSYIAGYERHASALEVEFVAGCGHFLPEERPELAISRLLWA